jgi:hypothetical protein
MEKLFEAYLDRLEELIDGIKETVTGLSQEALDWVPGPDMNSLCVIATHVAGSGRFWIGDVVAENPTGRNRDAEFRTEGVEAHELEKRLDDSVSYIRGELTKLSVVDMETKRVSPIDGRELTAGWALLHVLEHTGIHLGHVQITRQLWDQRQKQ